MTRFHELARGITPALLAALALSGCAESSDKVQASYVSPLTYQNVSCGQLREEAQRVTNRAATVAGLQNKQAEADAVATGVALVVFWPAAFFINGNKENAAELASLKGQLEAIEQANARKGCGIVFQKPAAKAVKAEAAAAKTGGTGSRVLTDKEKNQGMTASKSGWTARKETRVLTDKEKNQGF